NHMGNDERAASRQITKKTELVDEESIQGTAIRCILMLLPAMPPKHRYKVIFMMRPIAEVMASQQAMTSRLGTRGATLDHDQLERGLRAHREEMRRWGKTTPDVEWLEVDYPALVSDPALVITQCVG